MNKLDEIFNIEAGETWTAEQSKKQIRSLVNQIIGTKKDYPSYMDAGDILKAQQKRAKELLG